MIRVHEKQLGEMAQALALEQFEDDMVVHLHDFAPRHAQVIGDDWVRRTIQLGIARARPYGVTNLGLLRFYVELMFVLGGMFDSDPLQPWAGEILRDPSIPDEGTRIDHLYERTCWYLDAIEGPESSFSLQAMHNLQHIVLESTPAAELGEERRAVETMARVYPQRCAYLGEPALRGLVRRAVGEAARLDMATLGGVALTTGLMFAMGHGFAEDPLYPWVQATLRDPAIKGPERRVARLQRRVEIYLDRALKHLDGRRADGAR
jgi:hypothetical protein